MEGSEAFILGDKDEGEYIWHIHKIYVAGMIAFVVLNSRGRGYRATLKGFIQLTDKAELLEEGPRAYFKINASTKNGPLKAFADLEAVTLKNKFPFIQQDSGVFFSFKSVERGN